MTDADLKKLEEDIHNSKVVGIGEIGLDYYWTKDNKDKQILFFKKQLELAKKYKARLIPFFDASGKSNSIIAITPDSVSDIDNNRMLQKSLIGIVEHRLSPDLKYSALLHSKFYN